MKILYNWLNDLPQQFLEKERIEAVIKAFSKQMEEVNSAFMELETVTDIDSATGKNLDMVGTIVPVSRTEAYNILRKAKETTISDDLYRQVLKYKMLRDTSSCTYYDIVESIRMLWKAGDIHYSEKKDSPATIFISVNDSDIDGVDSMYGRATAIKPAGVKMVYTQGYIGLIDESEIEQFWLRAVDTYLAIDFFRHSKLLDGTKLLDGSRLMSENSPVSIGVSITNYGTYKKLEQSFSLSKVMYAAKMLTAFQNKLSDSIRTGFSVSFLETMQGIGVSLPIEIIEPIGEIGDMSITTFNVGTKLLDGSKKLNGTSIMNSIYRREIVE